VKFKNARDVCQNRIKNPRQNIFSRQDEQSVNAVERSEKICRGRKNLCGGEKILTKRAARCGGCSAATQRVV